MRILFLFSIFLLGVTACTDKLEEVELKSEDGYIEKFTREIDSQLKEGAYFRYDPDGNLMEQATYKNDSLDGERKLFFESGELEIIENYHKGQYKGLFEAYYENGQVQLSGQYVSNSMDGIWKRYYENGQLMEEVTFKNSAENGPFTEYFENGALKAQGNYFDGDNEHGELLLYNEAGELIRKMNCDKGVCRTTWKLEGEE